MSTGNRRKGQGSSNKVPHNRRNLGGRVGGKQNNTGSPTNNASQNNESNSSKRNISSGNGKSGNVKLDAKKVVIKTKITIITIGIIAAVAAVFILVTLAISFITAIFVIDEDSSSSSDSATSTAATSDVEVIEYDENNNPIVTYYSPEDYIKGLTYAYIGDNTSEEVYKVYAVVFRNVVALINKGDINKEEYNFTKPSTIPANSSSLIGSAINSVNKEILKDENNNIIKPKINTECTSSDIEQCPTSSGISLTIVEDLILNSQKNYKEVLLLYYPNSKVEESNILLNISDLSIKDTTKANTLQENLNDYLEKNNSSLEELNNYISESVNKNGYGTRNGVITAAVSSINFLYDNFNIKLPYFWGGKYTSKGFSNEFGNYVNNPTQSRGGNYYYYKSFDCSGFVQWAIINGGFKDPGTGTSNYDSSFSDKCSISSSDCVGAPGDLINSPNGHVELILGVDIDKQLYYVAESTSLGVIIRPRGLHKNNNKNNTSIINLDDFYSKNALTNGG